MRREAHELVIVGAGPAGLSAAARARARGVDYVVLERSDNAAETVHRYQKGKPVMAEPGLVPLQSDLPFEAGRREAVLGAWNEAISELGLDVRHGEEVTGIEPPGEGAADGFRVVTPSVEYRSEHVVLALGTQGNPRRLGVEGEDLPHVRRRLVDPAEHDGEEIVVVGAGDSALEVAIALAEANRVRLVVRRPEIVRAKEALEREIQRLAARGELEILYSTTVRSIESQAIELDGPDGTVRMPADRVFLMIGATPPRRFLEGLGVEFAGEGREARPVLDRTYQSTVPGLYLIGAVSGRDLIKLGMNQGYEVVEHITGHPVAPADEPVLAERLPFWDGPVRERIAALKAQVPLLAEVDEGELREMFLSAEARQVADGEVLVRQNDYTDSFLLVTDGRVSISARPEAGRAKGGTVAEGEERPVATLGAGDFFGEMSLISGRRRNATVRSLGTTRLVEIPRKAMLRLLARVPEVRRRVDRTFLVRAFQSYLFPDLPAEVLDDLVTRATVEELGRDHVLFREGDEGEALYLIRSGMVKISRASGGEERVLSYLTAGNFFGETALLAGIRRTATVTTIFPSEIVRLDRAEFEAHLERYPDLRPRFEEKLEERRVASLLATATPGTAEIQGKLVDLEIVMGTNVLLIDEHKCIRCGNCIAACEGVHEDGQARLSLTGKHLFNLLAPNSCWQCEDPLCMLDCPPDALVRDAQGEIHIRSNCIGCGNCAANCPYDNIFMVHPREGREPFGWLKRLVGMKLPEAEREVAVKCDMTHLPGGPACVRSCPTGAAVRLGREEYEETIADIAVQQGAL